MANISPKLAEIIGKELNIPEDEVAFYLKKSVEDKAGNPILAFLLVNLVRIASLMFKADWTKKQEDDAKKRAKKEAEEAARIERESRRNLPAINPFDTPVDNVIWDIIRDDDNDPYTYRRNWGDDWINSKNEKDEYMRIYEQLIRQKMRDKGIW